MEQQPTPSETKNKSHGARKSILKRWWFWLIVLVVLASAIFFAIDYLGDDEDSADNAVEFSNVDLTVKRCEGKYIDTHTHWDNEEYPKTLSKRMSENGVGCAIIFTAVNKEESDDDPLDEIKEDLNPFIEKFIPFFHVDPKTPEDINIANIRKANEIKTGYFSGFGEIAFYRDPLKKAELTDANWQSVLSYLGENNLWLMFHLRGADQIDKLEEILVKYPKNKFLLHGPELYKELPDLLKKHTNLYFTLDTASLIQLPNNNIGLILMYPQGFEKSGFTKYFDSNKETILNQAIDKWKPIVLAAPDRVMWGTDASLQWHTDQDVYSKLISFSDDFAATLAENIQKAYKYDNAYKLFVE